jgi:hypothetical protein
MNLSVPEQRLVDFAHEQFGEQISQFLLAGLGEEKVGQRGRFTITYAGSENSCLERHVEVITYEPADGSSYLPRGRNPLVLIALLHLLMNGNQGSLNTLRYEQAEVLSLLGWQDTKEARREIDKAEARYFKLTYQWQMNESELAGAGFSFYTVDEAMLSEVTSIKTEDVQAVRAVFNEHFIEHLLGRSLFGIDWHNVKSVLLQFPSRK